MTAALLVVASLVLVGWTWFLWVRAGHRWERLSTREREKRSRSSFLFSERGRRRPDRSRGIDRTSR